MPDSLNDVTVQRIVVRTGLSMGLAADLLADIAAEVDHLQRLTGPMPNVDRSHAYYH